jgi:hypothetical protein
MRNRLVAEVVLAVALVDWWVLVVVVLRVAAVAMSVSPPVGITLLLQAAFVLAESMPRAWVAVVEARRLRGG